MDRRHFIQAGLGASVAALGGAALTDSAMAQELPDVVLDMMAKQSGQRIFKDKPLSQNLLARGFGYVPDLEGPFDIRFDTAEGTKPFNELAKGKIRLISFWADWCPPCLWEMAELAALQKRHADESFEIVSLRSGDNKRRTYAEAREIVTQNGGEDLSLWNEVNSGNGFYSAVTKVRMTPDAPPRNSIPCLLLVDRVGKIRGRMVGLMALPKTPPPSPPPAIKPDASKGDVIVDTVEARPLQDTDRAPTILSSSDADLFIEALKQGA